MNARAACFSFDEPLKLRRFSRVRFLTYLSISVFEYLTIQSCCKASLALILLCGLNSSMRCTRSIASGEIFYHSISSVRNSPFFTFFIMSSSVYPLNGGYPQRNRNKITPILQRSHFSSYELFRTSGAI